MDAVEYLKGRTRMTKAGKRNICGISCNECPLYEGNNGLEVDCQAIESAYPEKAVAIVKKWAAEHPIKTRQSEFLKMFPNVPMENGILLTNPCWVDSTVKCLKQKSDGVYEDAPERCIECREEYWLTEVE